MKKAECFAGMQPPADLSLEEAACFAVCFGQLGRTDAGRACAQLDYYLRRFGVFLEKAREEERLSASMDRRLGLAAGAILGLLVL